MSESWCISIDEYAAGICEAIDNAAKLCLPKSGGVANKKSKGILGWNEYVKPYQAECKFWFGVWQAAGRPREGELFILKQNAHMQYKYSIGKLKRAKSQKLQNKFGGGDIFKEIKKFRGQNTTISNCIDGEVGAQNISDHFPEIYENLYSQQPLGEDFDKVQQNIQYPL